MSRYTRLVLGVMLCTGLQVGCAPAPTPDPFAEVRRMGDTMARDSAQSHARVTEFLCMMDGAMAAEMVRKRDERGETLPEALARLDTAAQPPPTDPGALAIIEAHRQYARQVHAHPAWTQADASAYATQACFRATQASDQQRDRQVDCRFQGLTAEVVAKDRDTEHTSRKTMLARYDRALRDPYSTAEGRATIAAMRRVAEAVYARPTWTPAQLREWAEQECLRMPPH